MTELLWRWCGSPLVAALLALVPACARAEDLRIYTEENPPLSFTLDGKPAGFATEMVQEILHRLKVDAPIRSLPWVRAYQLALVEQDVMIYPATRIAEREHLFRWVGPLTSVKTSFYVKSSSGIRIRSLEDARKLPNIGVVRQFYSEQFLLDAGLRNLEPADSLSMLMKKFMADRNPVMVTQDFALGPMLEAERVPKEAVSQQFTFLQTGHYLAFSLQTPVETVQLWQKTLDDLKKDGTFARRFKFWLPEEKLP